MSASSKVAGNRKGIEALSRIRNKAEENLNPDASHLGIRYMGFLATRQ
jgi:hypothetical protein